MLVTTKTVICKLLSGRHAACIVKANRPESGPELVTDLPSWSLTRTIALLVCLPTSQRRYREGSLPRELLPQVCSI